MRRLFLGALFVAAGVSVLAGQSPSTTDRLPTERLDVLPPSARVTGTLGSLSVQERSCPRRDLADASLRQRIVDVAAQEWGYFGLTVVDYTGPDPFDRSRRRGRRGWSLLNPTDTVRVADSIAGYWTITPEGSWIIENQNERWTRSGTESRWRTPWSAAFISWVMCESGLSEMSEFRRAVAHHSYIDQAIRARDGASATAAYTAFDIGETEISPGDLLCSGRRPAYRSLAERRRQLGEGARTHCDVVVKLEPARHRILAIGGNVRATVGLKLLPAQTDDAVGLRPDGGARPLFAHLKLAADPIDGGALDESPTMHAIACAGRSVPSHLAAAAVGPPVGRTIRC